MPPARILRVRSLAVYLTVPVKRNFGRGGVATEVKTRGKLREKSYGFRGQPI